VGLDPELTIWETDFCHVLQLIHAEGMRNGIQYQWRNYFAPDQELIDQFEKLANQEPLEDL
jgi:thymidylate synthase